MPSNPQPNETIIVDGIERQVLPCPDGIQGCEVLHLAPASDFDWSDQDAINALYRKHGATGIQQQVDVTVRKVLAATIVNQPSQPPTAAPAPPSVETWRPINTAPKNRKLIVGYLNPLRKWRTILASYHTEGTLESDTDESGFAPEGWYEATEAYEYLMPVEHEPSHWMPLPDPPKENQP
jgi:hypothetical protein